MNFLSFNNPHGQVMNSAKLKDNDLPGLKKFLEIPEKILGYEKFYADEYDAFKKYYEVLKKNGLKKELPKAADISSIREIMIKLRSTECCTMDLNFQGNFENQNIGLPTNQLFNKGIEFAGSRVKMGKSEDKGRHLIAAKNIPIGTRFIQEKATVLQVDPSCKCVATSIGMIRCHHCAYAVSPFYTCSHCNVVAFCSTNCLEESFHQYHKYECMGLQRHYWKLNNTSYSYLALRMLLYGKLHTFDYTQSPGKLRWGSTSNNYPTMYQLKTNFDKLPVEKVYEILKESTRTIFYLLLFTSYFNEENIPDRRICLFQTGGLLVKHYCQAKMNSLVVSYRNFERPFGFNEIANTGKALCPTIALLNHSCSPNAVIKTYNNIFIVEALRPIKTGEEITVAYTEIDSFKVLEERQLIMTNFFYFNSPCKCSFCAYEQTWQEYAYRCTLCPEGSAKKVIMENKELKLVCKDCKRTQPASQLAKLEPEINRIISKYQNKIKSRESNKYRSYGEDISKEDVEDFQKLHTHYATLYTPNSWINLDTSVTIFEELYKIYAKYGDYMFLLIEYGMDIFTIVEQHLPARSLTIVFSKFKYYALIIDTPTFLKKRNITVRDKEIFETFESIYKDTLKDLLIYVPVEFTSYYERLLERIDNVRAQNGLNKAIVV